MDHVIRTFKDLNVWQKALALCERIYRVTALRYPSDERFGLTFETRKTARSIVSNIAEGHRRRSRLEYLRFIDIAAGSAAELETQLLLAERLGYLVGDDCMREPLAEIDAMLSGLKRALMKGIHEERS